MLIIGCDYHPGFQQIAFVDQETGECGERRLQHPEEAQQFYRELHARGETVRVGMEASGHAQWFERLLGELHFQLDIGDAAEIRARRVRKQKTDRQDAQLILGSLAQFVGKRAVEKAAPWKSPRTGLSHSAWKSRKNGGIPTFSTAPATGG
jgi:transposase